MVVFLPIPYTFAMSAPSVSKPAGISHDSAQRWKIRTWKRRLLAMGACAAVFYCVLLAGFDYAMHQPPETFARLMMHVGPAPFLLFPFETMWKSARVGKLQ